MVMFHGLESFVRSSAYGEFVWIATMLTVGALLVNLLWLRLHIRRAKRKKREADLDLIREGSI